MNIYFMANILVKEKQEHNRGLERITRNLVFQSPIKTQYPNIESLRSPEKLSFRTPSMNHHRIPKMGLEHKYASFGLTYTVLVK